MTFRLLVSTMLFAVALPQSATAQDGTSPAPRDTAGLPRELQPIDQALTGGLLNDPTLITWDVYGDALTSEVIVDPAYPGGGAARRLTQGRAGEVYASGMNIPILARVPAGERVTVGFYARTIASSAQDGNARVGVRFQQNREPYPGFGAATIEIGSEWDWYEVSAVADSDMRRDWIVAIQFGLQAQTVEIGQAVVVSGVTSVLD